MPQSWIPISFDIHKFSYKSLRCWRLNSNFISQTLPTACNVSINVNQWSEIYCLTLLTHSALYIYHHLGPHRHPNLLENTDMPYVYATMIFAYLRVRIKYGAINTDYIKRCIFTSIHNCISLTHSNLSSPHAGCFMYHSNLIPGAKTPVLI